MNEPSSPDDATAPAGPPTDTDIAFVVPAPAVAEAIASPGSEPVAVEVDAEVIPRTPNAPGEPALVEAVRELGASLAERLGEPGLLEAIRKRLDQVHVALEREGRAEANREKVVDRLHAELQDYKNDLLLKVLRPVFVDLIQLHDDVGKMIDGLGDEGGRALDALRDVPQAIEDILYRQGVEPFQVGDDAFDPKRQRAVSTVPTDDPARNKAVAARLRKGFRASDKVIRPEIVSVYAYKAAD